MTDPGPPPEPDREPAPAQPDREPAPAQPDREPAPAEPAPPADGAARSGPARRPARRVPLAMLVVLGLLTGAVVGLGAALVLTDDGANDSRITLSTADEVSEADAAAAKQAFLDAWRRYRTATYTAELVFERVAANGQTLRSVSTYAQQPPRRSVRSADSASITAGAASLTCSTVNAQLVCAPGPNADYAASVDQELATWATALDGDTPYYRVANPADGCFELTLAVAIADPPYGDVARFCFDAATGALAKRQIVRAAATDTEEATSIAATVAADAFVPPTTTR